MRDFFIQENGLKYCLPMCGNLLPPWYTRPTSPRTCVDYVAWRDLST